MEQGSYQTRVQGTTATATRKYFISLRQLGIPFYPYSMSNPPVHSNSDLNDYSPWCHHYSPETAKQFYYQFFIHILCLSDGEKDPIDLFFILFLPLVCE
jgi:hypothetical protein